jgi:hypothetical protein
VNRLCRRSLSQVFGATVFSSTIRFCSSCLDFPLLGLVVLRAAEIFICRPGLADLLDLLLSSISSVASVCSACSQFCVFVLDRSFCAKVRELGPPPCTLDLSVLFLSHRFQGSSFLSSSLFFHCGLLVTYRRCLMKCVKGGKICSEELCFEF